MSSIYSFTFQSINGYFKGLNEDIAWHIHGEEESHFSDQQLAKNNILLYGRKTYQMMQGFWNSEAARELYPKVAEKMYHSEKIVLSNTLTETDWQNTRLFSGDVLTQIKDLKANSTKDISILGSGSIVSMLSDAQLIDYYQVMIDPLLLAEGKSFCFPIQSSIALDLVGSQVFKSGTVLLTYHRKGAV